MLYFFLPNPIIFIFIIGFTFCKTKKKSNKGFLLYFVFKIEKALNTEFSTLFLLPRDIKLLINLDINQELKMGSFLLKKKTCLFSTNEFLIFDIF